MPQILRHRIIAAMSTLLLFAAGCATETQKSAGEAMDDTVIAGRVKTGLIGTKGIKANSINVEVYKGRVQLAGFVDSEFAKTEAVRVAKATPGVTSVSDGIVFVTVPRSVGEMTDDGVIAAKVKSAVTQVEGIDKSLDVNVEVRRGEVILSGFVPSEDARRKAGDAAKAVTGVTKIYNHIDVGS
jgi:hyperosmotically inducible periplasmic protein